MAASAKAGCDLDIFHKDVERPTGIWFNELLECDDGEIVFRHACKLGLEGIVSKRIDMKYLPGPSKSWVKLKNKKHPAILRIKEAFELERAQARKR